MQRYVGRIRVLTAACVLAALVIIGRLYYLQVMRGEDYARRADAQFVSLKSPLLNRGSIYFSAKDGTQVIAATLNAVASSSSKQRYYPGGSLAAQELGFVAYDNDNTQKGRYGLERYYDDTLSRQDSTTNLFAQLFGGVKEALQGGQGTGDLITTIEPTVQSELEHTLADYAAQWHPSVAGGIVMDPKTGEIAAMGEWPSFDLNSFNTVEDPLVFQNAMAQNVYEMGSIVKPLTMAAGIDSGAITEKTVYDDTGCITVDTAKICNYDLKARGPIPMQEILNQSLNVGASFIATTMGPTVMRDYFLNHYDVGQETGIDLPGEVHGLVNNLQSPRQVEYDTASFGQGIALTPIETVRALAVLANGGYLVTPHLGKAITYDTGITRPLGWGEPQQVLKPQTATTVSRMLTTVVDTKLANGKDKLDHFSVAAKTGTAQIANPAGGGYYPDRYLHSFFGYFPSFNARFVVFFYAVYPKGAQYASETWAPPFRQFSQFLINYYNIPPDR